jgi:hypothetical protein
MRISWAVGVASVLAVGAACSDHHDVDPSVKSKDPFANAAGRGSAGASSGGGGTHSAGSNVNGVVATTLPRFPGSGTSDAGDPLPNSMLCDSVSAEESPIPDRVETCYVDKNDPTTVAATLEEVLECVEEADTVHLRLTFHPWFVDNTYGANAIGWDHDGATAVAPMMAPMMGGMAKMPKMPKSGHTFMDLVGSDHAEIILTDAAGKTVMQFKLDYISQDASAPSGYACLGVTGGEGKMIIGDANDVVRWMTSEDRNLNERGYSSYTVDSPATDEDYTPNADTPEWDYRVVYEAWVDVEAFGAAGFGGATIEYVHASPSKTDSNTIEVMPGKCPPCNDPDRCHKDPPPPPPPPTTCGSNDPDEVCADASVPPPDNGGKPLSCDGGKECTVD